MFDLEERLIRFAVDLLKIAEKLPKNKAGLHIADQLVRSGTSPAYNYAEAQAAESRQDFIHKMKICLKELRETRVGLIIIVKAELLKPATLLDGIIAECNELVKSIKTASKTESR